jgi:hypothetical protein
MKWGSSLTGMVSTTARVETRMTEIESLKTLATYTSLPLGVTLTPHGTAPTAIVSMTVAVARSITETV